MPIESALTHPVFVRAREAALARPELRFARSPSAAAAPVVTTLTPPPPIKRLSHAPVRVVDMVPTIHRPYAGSIPAAPPPTPPSEVPAPLSPPMPEPARPEITDIPPGTVPVPVREPPVMPQPMAAG